MGLFVPDYDQLGDLQGGDMMIKRLFLSLVLVAVAALLIAVPVLAACYVYVVVESTGADYTQLALNMTLDVDGLIDGGYVNANGTDTRMTDSSYTVLPHMLAEDKVLWVSDLSGNTITHFIFWTDQEAMENFPVITGHGGYVTVPDNTDLEPGGIFAFVIVGYVDTSMGSDKNIIRKDDAVVFNVTDEEELTFAITGGNSLVASGVSSDYMTIMILSDGYELWMEIDEVEQDRVEASSIPDTANNWTLFENDVMPYISYYGEWVAT